MVLLAADGLRNDEITARLNCRREVVSRWRKRFFEARLAGLEDLPRWAGPRLFPLAAWDARRAKIFDRRAPKDGIVPFDALVDQFMSQAPYRQAQRVFLIVDNGSAHRGKRSIDRLQGAWPNLTLVHTPVHASWLNQCEIYFSVVQRKAVTPNDVPDLDAPEAHLLAFGRRYEQIAAPFDWRFTRQDRHKLLAKTDAAAPLAA